MSINIYKIKFNFFVLNFITLNNYQGVCVITEHTFKPGMVRKGAGLFRKGPKFK
jgi:hypothetical protein